MNCRGWLHFLALIGDPIEPVQEGLPVALIVDDVPPAQCCFRVEVAGKHLALLNREFKYPRRDLTEKLVLCCKLSRDTRVFI